MFAVDFHQAAIEGIRRYPRLTPPGRNEVQELLNPTDSVGIWSRKAVTVAVVRVQNWKGYWTNIDER